MKLAEKVNYAFESEQKFHNSYSFFDKNVRAKNVEDQRFVVPWQIVEERKMETLVK